MNDKILTLRDALRRQLSAARLRDWLPSRGSLLFTLLVAAFCLVGASRVLAAPQNMAAQAATSTGTIAYQGRLADASGAPLTGTYIIVFRLYDVASGGLPLWEESWTGANSVQVANGLFNVMLGSLTPIPQSVLNANNSLWLGIDVGTDAEMTPRVQLGSAPFAMQALTVTDGGITTAKLADGAVTSTKLDSNLSISGSMLAGSYMGVRTGTPQQALDVNGTLRIGPEINSYMNGVNLSYGDGGAGSFYFTGLRFGQHWNWQSGSPTGAKTQMHLFGGGDSSDTYLELYRSDQQGSPNVKLNANGNTYFMGGNVGIGTTNPTNPLEMGSGAYVSSGGTWTNASDRNLKKNFTSIDGKSLLEKVAGLPISEWNYKADKNGVKHIGPMAQDFYAAFNLGEDDKHISTVDASGVALAAIQSLHQRVKEQDAQIASQQQQIAALDARLAALERSGPAGGLLSVWDFVILAAIGLSAAALLLYQRHNQKKGGNFPIIGG